MFFCHFCHNYQLNTKIIIIIIIETIIIIIQNNFVHSRKTSFLTSKKEDQVARIGVRGGGIGDSGNARKKTFFSFDVFPYNCWCLFCLYLSKVCFEVWVAFATAKRRCYRWELWRHPCCLDLVFFRPTTSRIPNLRVDLPVCLCLPNGCPHYLPPMTRVAVCRRNVIVVITAPQLE